MGGSSRREHRRRQRHWPSLAWTGLAAGWPLALITIYCSSSLQKNQAGGWGLVICHRALRVSDSLLSTGR